jgi:hypothetical protein
MIDTIMITDRDDGAVIFSGPDVPPWQDRSLPAGILDDLPRMLDATLATVPVQTAPATLVIPSTDQLADHVGGWVISGLDADLGWYQAYRSTDRKPRRIQLCVLDRIDPGKNILFAPGWDPERIIWHLRRYRDLIGPWYATAGVSGVQLARSLVDHPNNRQARPRWVIGSETHHALVDKLDLPGPLDIIWQPVPGRGKPAGHRWDIRNQYLAAAQAAQLGTDTPERSGPLPFDAGRCGWWRARVSGVQHLPHVDSVGPPLWHPGAEVADGTVWLTTPMMSYAAQLGCHLEVVDSYTSPSSRRHLRVWAETIRDACYTMAGERDPAELHDAAKGTYAEAIGLCNRPGGRIFRPDWRATIIDLARVLLYRKLARVWSITGHWPARIDRDSVWYPGRVVKAWHSHDDGRSSFGEVLGEGVYIGRFRYEGYEKGKKA